MWRCILGLGFLVPLIGFADDAVVRDVTFSWDAKQGASAYGFQISKSAEMSPVLKEVKVKNPTVTLKLPPGQYYYRLKWFNKSGASSPWSEVITEIVNSGPPTLVLPGANEAFSQKLPKEGINFEWTAGVAGTSSHIEIKDKSGVVLKRQVEGNTLQWLPIESGHYDWRVGFEFSNEVEWTEYRGFDVAEPALRKKIKIITKTVQAKVKSTYLNFQTFLGYAYQSSSQNLLTSGFDIAPELILNNNLSARLYFGILGGAKTESRIENTEEIKEIKKGFILEFGGIFYFAISKSWSLGFGPGAQAWLIGATEYFPAVITSIVFKRNSDTLKFWDRIYFNYEGVLLSKKEGTDSGYTHLVKGGLGFSF